MATLNPARYLGRKNEGAVRRGAAANLLLLDADPLADVSNTLRISGSMVNGTWRDAATLAALRAEVTGKAAGIGEESVVYENASIWTGKGFERRTLATRAGRFVDGGTAAPGARRVDLAGSFVVPAYANAHAHLTPATANGSWAFLKEGVFYAWNPNTVVLGQQSLDFFARADTYDILIAQGGITEPGGHPQKLYVDVLAKWVPGYKGKTLEDFLGDAFHYGRNRDEIDAALDLLKKQKAGFVKAYLLNSEDYATRRDDPKSYGHKGLNPVNFSYLVAAARQRGLKVATHVETVHDLKVAALSGAAVAAHLPGYWDVKTQKELDARTLTPADAALVVRSGMMLVPTYAIAREKYDEAAAKGPIDTNMMKRVLAVQARNIRLLKEAGATLLVGTDTSGPIFNEVEHLVAIGAFGTGEILQATLETGARLFPARRIGCFATGCEADFLVLSQDPSVDIAALRRITRRVKAGVEIREEPTQPAR